MSNIEIAFQVYRCKYQETAGIAGKIPLTIAYARVTRFHSVSKVSKLTSLRGCKTILLFHAFYVSIKKEIDIPLERPRGRTL